MSKAQSNHKYIDNKSMVLDSNNSSIVMGNLVQMASSGRASGGRQGSRTSAEIEKEREAAIEKVNYSLMYAGVLRTRTYEVRFPTDVKTSPGGEGNGDRLPKDKKVYVVPFEEIKEVGGFKWIKIYYEENKTGWVDFGDLVEDEGSGKIADKYYASERLKIRDTPNGQQIDGNRVFTSGAIVKIHESKETQKVDGSDSTWIKIYYDSNKVGWVGKELLEELPQPVTGHNFKYNWDKSQYVSQDFKDKAAGVAKSLGIDPDDLMAIMAFESYFNPAQKNMGGGSATGLVQFMPDTAQDLHTTTTELAAMTGVEQLDYVYGYFYPYKGRLVTLSDIYMRVLWPAGIGKGEDEAIFTKGDGRYEANSGLDIDFDNKITKKEATQKVIDERSKY